MFLNPIDTLIIISVPTVDESFAVKSKCNNVSKIELNRFSSYCQSLLTIKFSENACNLSTAVESTASALAAYSLAVTSRSH